MNSEILVNITPMETRVAVIENGAVQELFIERNEGRGIVGNIYIGGTGKTSLTIKIKDLENYNTSATTKVLPPIKIKSSLLAVFKAFL